MTRTEIDLAPGETVCINGVSVSLIDVADGTAFLRIDGQDYREYRCACAARLVAPHEAVRLNQAKCPNCGLGHFLREVSEHV